MVPCFGQSVPCQLVDQLCVRLLDGAVDVGVDPLVLVSPVGLRVFEFPCLDLIFIDENAPVLDPSCKLVKGFGVVVGTDPGLEPIVPLVNSTDQVLSFNTAIREESSAM